MSHRWKAFFPLAAVAGLPSRRATEPQSKRNVTRLTAEDAKVLAKDAKKPSSLRPSAQTSAPFALNPNSEMGWPFCVAQVSEPAVSPTSQSAGPW